MLVKGWRPAQIRTAHVLSVKNPPKAELTELMTCFPYMFYGDSKKLRLYC